ncbi:MAG: hypothetical protein JO270_14395 [Acidobacteriaceae bacterium]|nr:hypothetical protein [Acidobacteriaceae bacterium]
MSDQTKQTSCQPDKNVAADERPVPSQAEGDRETVEQDLAGKEKAQEKSAGQ